MEICYLKIYKTYKASQVNEAGRRKLCTAGQYDTDAGFCLCILCLCVGVLIKTELLMTAVSRERLNSDTDSPLSGAFSVLCGVKLKQKKQFDYIQTIHKLSIKISCSSEGTFKTTGRGMMQNQLPPRVL